MDTRSYAFLFAAMAAGAGQAQDIRSATADNLNVAGAWVDGSVPVAADIATWNASSTLANTLAAGQTWGGLNLSAASGAVSIGGAFNLTLDHSTDASTILNTGAQNFTWGTDGAGGQLNLIGALSATAPGNGNVNPGATFAGGGVVTLSSTGTKNWSTSGSATNGANGMTHVSFTGTLRLRGATTAIEALGGNWLAFGGGGGTTGVPGAVTQTGAFHLDTGDAASRGDFILTNGINDKSLELASLSGTGNLRADWGVGATLSERGVHINQASDTVFAGGIYTHNGSGQRRNITITKDGAGTLVFTGRLGSSQGTAGNPAGLSFAINGGVWQMGDGNENPSAPLNAANWDSASTFSIGAGGTLRFMANATEYVWDRPLSGIGALVIASDGTTGEGKVALTALDSSSFTGTTTVQAGRLRIGGDLGGSAVTVASGAGIAPGGITQPSAGFVKSLTLAGGSSSEFRAGTMYDELVVNDPNGLVVSGPHVINASSSGGLNFGDTVSMIDYEGSFTGFANLSLAPGSRFSLVHNIANTRVELKYGGGTITWTGGNGSWEVGGPTNWTLGGSPNTFLQGDDTLFVNGASTGNVTVNGALTPASVTIINSTLPYVFSGTGSIGGNGSFTKQGSGTATVAVASSYSGGTVVEEGTLTLGDGASAGEIGSGATAVLAGATLRLNRSDLLDYKATPKLRNVSGAGTIVIEGGGTVFNYTGAGLGFAEGGAWSDFSGNLAVRGGSEFQTIRNGATAMGSGDIILGDASTSGRLSQIEGNWTWTNDIVLTGSDNRILNRSAGSGRSMKLQGVISGSGNLTLEDTTAAMTNLEAGFVLTGENTMSGTLAIPLNTPVRVGGIPGNTDVSQIGAGASGSLGSATVQNEGTLTFSRTDAHTVANAISGAGQVFIGLSTGSADQVVSFTGTKSYSGPTTVRSGALRVNTTLPASPLVVDAAGTIGGSGTISTASAVSGTVAPGAGTGTLSFGDDLALEAGSRIAWEISDWNGSAGTGYDTIHTGTLTIGATSAAPVTIVITPASLVNFSSAAKTFTLATTTGEILGLDAGEIIVDSSALPGSWSVQAVGNVLQLFYAPGSSYDTWEAANGIAGAGANADSDNDGIPNGIEFVIGGDPSDSPSNALAPLIVVDAASLNFSFRRTDVSASFNPVVEYGTGLGSWIVAEPGVPSGTPVLIEENNDFYGTGIDRVTVKIPRVLANPGSKLFARLRVGIP